jgi:transglutaminase-like putative cysteine protease
MSRLEFRAEVPDARPSSAWLLATVAGATLWITEQLAFWAIAIQASAILFSLLTRSRPYTWQTHPLALNLGMFGIVAVTIGLALQGNPATVSLAHFAALTQGLQLLDTRPRKSEFLLVALALFQVILAANLTDSVLFPPLLVVFLVATTWTLLVHTLRTEAIEARETGTIPGAIDAGLLQMTLIASALCILMALVLFVMLPRMRSSLIRAGVGGDLALAGFSDRVTLGTIGRIRQDSTTVLRVETLEGRAPERPLAYWRGLAFDTFDGREWSISPISKLRSRAAAPGHPRLGVDLGDHPSRSTLVQRVTREPVEAGVIFGIGRPRSLRGALNRLEIDANGGLYAFGQEGDRVRYTIATDSRLWRDEALREDLAELPRGGAGRTGRYLGLPELDAAIFELARRITQGLESDADRVRAIESHLRREGVYTDTPPDMGDDRSPVEGFLMGELAGHCEYFASAMVVLARAVGIPARLVNGFAGGRRNRLGGFVELARSDAHAWVEVHYREAGWVRYDPTPPDLRLRDALALTLAENLAQLGSAIELWWFQRVVDFDSSDQIQALKAAWGAWRALGNAPGAGQKKIGEDPTFGWRPDGDLPWQTILLSAAAAALLIEFRRRRRGDPASRLPRSYRRALRLLARRGLARDPCTTARDFAVEVSATLPNPAAAAFAALTEDYLAERFGGRELEDSAGRHLERLRSSLASPFWRRAA